MNEWTGVHNTHVNTKFWMFFFLWKTQTSYRVICNFYGIKRIFRKIIWEHFVKIVFKSIRSHLSVVAYILEPTSKRYRHFADNYVVHKNDLKIFNFFWSDEEKRLLCTIKTLSIKSSCTYIRRKLRVYSELFILFSPFLFFKTFYANHLILYID